MLSLFPAVVMLIVTNAMTLARSRDGLDESLSIAFHLGQSYGDKSTGYAGNNVKAGKAAGGSDCRRRVADKLQNKLRAAGFLVERQFLAQLLNNNLHDKICRLYASESLTNCLNTEGRYPAHSSNPPMLGLLSSICDTYSNAIQRHAECIADVGGKMERQCTVACRQQIHDAPTTDADMQAEFARAITAPRLSDAQAEGLCRVELCIVHCVNAQLAECESESNGEVPVLNKSALAALYERVNAFQMLIGLESVQNVEAIPAFIKGGKLPSKCQTFLRKTDDNSSIQTSNLPAVIDETDVKLTKLH